MRALVAAVSLSVLVGCGKDEPARPAIDDNAPCDTGLAPGQPFGVECGELVDSLGRVAYLRGVNARVDGVFDVSFDDGRTALEPIPQFSSADASAILDFGFDALRLPINWSALEPTQDGGFDPEYLARIESTVELARAAGLVVLLDLHQDAYSKEIGEDGAPLWAIVPPPTELLEGPLTDLDARRLSEQVIRAFETFFGASSDGDRLRARFTAAAVHVSERFAGNPAVIGFEIFNEPQTDDAGVALLNQVAYPALARAAPDKLYVFEPSAVRNLLDKSSLPEAPLGPMTVYAPHVYTLAFMGSDATKQAMTKETLRRSNDNARIEADAWQAPLVITEWGYDPNGIRAGEYVTWQSELQEEYRASSFFWLWKEQSQGFWGCYDYDAPSGVFSPREALRQALARVRPARVAGWPVRFGFDRQSGIFELVFLGNPALESDHEIAVAPALGAPLGAECDGTSVELRSLAAARFGVSCGRASSAEHVLRVRVGAQ